jgi:hypothetical protein
VPGAVEALAASAPAYLRDLTPLAAVAAVCGVCAVMSAVVGSGGVWLAANHIAVVTTSGAPAAPRRIVRALLAWSWLLLLALAHRAVLPRQFIVVVPLALWHAATHPTEGLGRSARCDAVGAAMNRHRGVSDLEAAPPCLAESA